MARRSRRSPALRIAVRAGAAGAIAAAVAVPLLRRRLRIPAPVTIAACATGPLALAVLYPRSHKRDVGLFALQMWAFTMVHEIPYDDPDRLRDRLRTRYPIVADRAIGLGRLPNARLQRGLSRLPGVGILDRFLTWVHWLWFIEPYAALLYILIRHPDRFPRAARQIAAVFDLGCVGYFAVPTAPPWWASEQGLTGEPVQRIMVGVGEKTWRGAWPKMYAALGGNPWAAMPSLHFATSTMAAISLSEAGRRPGTVGWAYALTLGFGLVYLGEHYVTDLAAGSRPGRDGAGRRAARGTGRRSASTPVSDAWRGSPTPRCSSFWEVSPEDSANGNGAPTLPLFTTRRLVQTILLVLVLLVAIYFLFPKLVGLGDSLSKLGDADLVWVLVAIGFCVVGIATYIALFKAVVGGDALRLTWGETYEINMAGVAATLLFSAGGAGGIALTYWALRKAGMERHDVGRRMVAFLSLHYAFYPLALIVFGVLLRTGVLPGKNSVELTIVPAAVAGLFILLGVLVALIPADVGRRVSNHFQGERTHAIVDIDRQSPGDRGGGAPVRARALRPSQARRPGRPRRRRLLGREHRNPLGIVPRLRDPDADRGRRPGLLPRHGRQPVPAGAGRGRRGRRRDDRRLRPLRHPRGDGVPGDPDLPAGGVLAADTGRCRRLLPAPGPGPELGRRGAADRSPRG